MNYRTLIGAAAALLLAACSNAPTYTPRPYVPRDTPKQEAKETVTIDKVTRGNLIPLALQNNPDIQAGRFSSEFVELLSAFNLSQYTPQFNVRMDSDYRHFRDPALEALGRGRVETSISQKTDWGLTAKIYVDAAADTLSDPSTTQTYGLELEYRIPGLSRSLAGEQLANPLRVQEPVKDRVNFVGDMRAKLEDVITQFYENHRSNHDWLEAERGIRLAELTKLQAIYKTKLAEAPSDRLESELQALEGLIRTSTNDVQNVIPSEISKTERKLRTNLGLTVTPLALDFENPDSLPVYEATLQRIIENDPQIQRYIIEIDIAHAQIEAADIEWEVKLFAGGFNDLTDQFRPEGYVGVSAEFSTSAIRQFFGGKGGKDLQIAAYGASARSFEAKIRGRAATLAAQTYDLYETFRQNQTSLRKNESEIREKEAAYRKAVEAFERGESWVSFQQLKDLLVAWVGSAFDIFNYRKSQEKNVEILKVRTGEFDRIKTTAQEK